MSAPEASGADHASERRGAPVGRGVLRALLLLTVVFVLGALSGVAIVRVYLAHRLRAALDGPPGLLAEQPILFVLDRRLGLSPSQHERAAAILAAHRDELRGLHRRVVPEIIALRRREADELGPSLDAGQRRRLDELQAETNARLQRWIEPGGPP